MAPGVATSVPIEWPAPDEARIAGVACGVDTMGLGSVCVTGTTRTEAICSCSSSWEMYQAPPPSTNAIKKQIIPANESASKGDLTVCVA